MLSAGLNTVNERQALIEKVDDGVVSQLSTVLPTPCSSPCVARVDETTIFVAAGMINTDPFMLKNAYLIDHASDSLTEVAQMVLF